MLGVSFSRLARAVWSEKIAPPEKGPGGAFLWTPSDIRRASWALCGRPFNESRLTSREVRT